MNRKLAIVAAIIAAFAFTVQAADAKGRKHRVDKRIAAVAVGVGAASTLTFLSLNSWRWDNGYGTNGLTTWGAWGITTIGCAALSPIVATAVLNRPLKYREAHILIGSCVIPIVGGWLVNEAYNAHWITAPDEKVGRRHHRRSKKK